MNSWRALLNGLIDYAGLFPPASLDMQSAVDEFRRNSHGDDSHILSRFVLPLARLEEFIQAAKTVRGNVTDDSRWHLSVIAGQDVNATVERLLKFNRAESRNAARLAVCDCIEVPAASADEIRNILASVPGFFQLYIEIPLNVDAPGLIAALAGTRAAAKMRTGGVVASAIPESPEVIRFMRACNEHGVPFKATAGLHHAMRGSYPLTYESDAATGNMFGYLNVFLAAAFMKAGLSDAELMSILDETSSDAFVFEENGVTWHNYTVSAEALADIRENFARSFGSCSFTEPVAEAKALGLSHATR